MNKKFNSLLKEELKILEQTNDMLKYSYDSCKNISMKENVSLEKLDKIEAFTSRFARIADIIIQKIFRLLDKIDLEDDGTVRDRINRAEKKGMIDNADIFIEIRILRNDIAHEYLSTSMKDIFKKVLELTPYIFNSVEKIKNYCQKYN